jgi:hypothetical protein
MWGATRAAPTHGAMLRSLGDILPGAKTAYWHDAYALIAILWARMRAAGVRQHDAFSCAKHGAGAAGSSTGWPYPRAGGEHVGAVYYTEKEQMPGIDTEGLGKAEETCPPMASAPAANRTVLRLGSGDAAAAVAPRLAVAVLAPQQPELPPGSPGPRGHPRPGALAAAAAAAAGDADADAVPLVEAYELRYALIDAAEPCRAAGAAAAAAPPAQPGGAPVEPNGTATLPPLRLPVLFNYTHLAAFPPPRHPAGCPSPAPAAVPQYHKRFPAPKGHYDAYPGGIAWARLLLVSDAWYRLDPALALSEGLPALAHALARLPPHGRLLLPEGPGTDALMVGAAAWGAAAGVGNTSAGAAGGAGNASAAAAAPLPPPPPPPAGALAWGGRAVGPDEFGTWRRAAWALPQRPAPWLGWAYRAVVLTSPARPLAALPRRGAHWVDASEPPDAADADAAFAAAAYQLAASAAGQAHTPSGAGAGSGGRGNGTAARGCRVVVAAPPALAPVNVTAGTGWRAEALAEGAAPLAAALAVAAADLLVVAPDAPPLYLGLARRGATVLFLPPQRAAGGFAAGLWPGRAATGDPPCPLFCAAASARCACVGRAKGPAAAAAAVASAIDRAVAGARCGSPTGGQP